jgi:hypothetical protein
MKKMIKIANKCTKERKPKINYSRKSFAQKKIAPHQKKMKIVEVRQKGFYSWKYKTLMKKEPPNNMDMHKLTTKKN